MSKVTMTIEELINLTRGELPLEETKKNIADALMEVWLNHPSVRKGIEKEAEEIAQDKVKRLLREAFNETHPYHWGTNERKVTFTGWASAIIENCFNDAMKVAGLQTGKPLRDMVTDVVIQKHIEFDKKIKASMDSLKEMVDDEVRKLVPQYMTDEYKERVANHFDEKKMGEMLQEMVTKAIGGMLMSGALTLNGGRQE